MAYTTINKSSEHFNTKLYTGNNGTQAITGVGFAPDLVWTKARNGTNSHLWYDKVRGVHKYIRSDQTGAEGTATNTLTSFDSDGFTVGDGDNGNASGANGVAWNWKANGQGSSNTDGSINSIATSANTTSGFSIVKYTGNGSTNQTVGHGLGAEPDFIIIKQTNTTRNWPTYSKAMGNGVAFLDITDAWNGGSGYTNYWYTSGMTSTTFGISNNDNNNQSGGTYIAYVFSSKTGYSKFGKYTGNGSADGTFIYTGFKPQLVMLKQASGNTNWAMNDIKRQQYNAQDIILYADSNGAESGYGGNFFDILSNGFKQRMSGSYYNGSGSTYIYMAFAEAPLVGTNNVPCTAR